MGVSAVAVYCGSATGNDARHAATAAALGVALAEHDIDLVYGGGHIGLMGIVADAALGAGGRVIGVITQSLVRAEVGHGNITELITVETMHERKLAMSERADAFVMLPGGYGTLDEFFEAVTWTQLRIHDKPCLILDPTGYYAPLIEFIDRSVTEGFVQPKNRALIETYASIGALLDRLAAA
jgi:uncharacterized protein (TIGR00730 family)